MMLSTWIRKGEGEEGLGAIKSHLAVLRLNEQLDINEEMSEKQTKILV